RFSRDWSSECALPICADLVPLLADGDAAAALAEAFPSARASARNRFTGIVTRVEVDGVMAQVDIQAGPFRVVSLMSREAAEELEIGRASGRGREQSAG